jgi:endonuclease/exonuclease/phosphatase family metal-dependent hydrolase
MVTSSWEAAAPAVQCRRRHGVFAGKLRWPKKVIARMNQIHISACLCAVGAAVAVSPAVAQWNPAAGQWGKSEPNDLRIMTWNVQDDICSTSNKVEAFNDWSAAARIVAAMKPDILILQECGDNSGEGTGSTEDTVAQLTTAIGMFLHGGTDSFHSGSAITSWVQKYAPSYDLPYVFVSTVTDGYNRNVILSRYAFGDVNGDGVATYSDISVQADAYAPGGNGGIRGFMTAEILLPSSVYAGNLVMGCAHLKSGGASSDLSDRLLAAENISYYIDRLFNGAGTGTPDPNHRITLNPRPTTILGPTTPFICGGDFNESVAAEGRYGPAQWIAQGPAQGGTDGNDRDRTDSTYDDARDLFTNSPLTEGGRYKDDYLVWQDSIAALRRVWIFNTATIPSGGMPSEMTGYTSGAAGASTKASDHLPVVADFILPLGSPAAPTINQQPGSGTACYSGSAAFSVGASGAGTLTYQWQIQIGANQWQALTGSAAALPCGGSATATPPGNANTQIAVTPCPGVFSYAVRCVVSNAGGSTPSNPAAYSVCYANCDCSSSAPVLNVNDFTCFLQKFGIADPYANCDGSTTSPVLNVSDFTCFLQSFAQGCP